MGVEFVTTIGQDSHRFVEVNSHVEMNFLEGSDSLIEVDSLEENPSLAETDSFVDIHSPTAIYSRAGQKSAVNFSNQKKIASCTSDSMALPERNQILKLGGVPIPGCPALAGNSDADVILHALTNAISGLSGVNILGGLADELCRKGVKDSAIYLQEALNTLPPGTTILHVSITLEGRRPKLKPYIDAIKESISSLLGISADRVGLTATTGEGLTAFGKGKGIQVFCLMSFRVERP